MRVARPLLLMLAALVGHGSVQAQKIYMCKDASGRTFTSDRAIPECVDRPLREYDRRGIARREIPAPLTAEQKRQIELQQERRRFELVAAEQQRRSDYAMQARYRDEADLERARAQALAATQERLSRERELLAAAQKRRQRAQAEADALDRKNAAVPIELLRSVEESEQEIGISQKLIDAHQADIAQINAKFDGMLNRYRLIAADRR